MIEFVAEIGLNHNGNFDLACEMIRQAKFCGADVVKMQLGWRDGIEDINCIDYDILTKLFKYADFVGIELMFSIFNYSAFRLIKKFNVKRYKIASRTVACNIELVTEIVNQDKDIVISLGMWDKKEVPIVNNNIKYLWCKSIYPTMPWDMSGFPKDFNNSIYYGYSDHSLGIGSSLIAISRGARMIEKHFTLDKSDSTIRDHALSANCEEFAKLVSLGERLIDT